MNPRTKRLRRHRRAQRIFVARFIYPEIRKSVKRAFGAWNTELPSIEFTRCALKDTIIAHLIDTISALEDRGLIVPPLAQLDIGEFLLGGAIRSAVIEGSAKV